MWGRPSDPKSVSFGTTLAQRSIALGQRGWNGQPAGGLSGSGISPFSTTRALRRAGSDSGTAEMAGKQVAAQKVGP
jgi:hypothetical protein